MISLTIANGIVPYFMTQTTAGVLLLIPIIIVEAILLEKLLKRNLVESLKFCTVANIISTLAGICFIFIEIPIYSLSDSMILISLLLIFVVAFTVSILLEYKVYRHFWESISRRKLFRAVIIANVITYIPLTSLTIYAFKSNAKAPEKARRISCLSNLKQIGLGLKMYAYDNKGFLPNKSGIEGLEQLRGNGYSNYNNFYQCPSCSPQKIQEQKLTKENVDYIYFAGLQDPPVDGKDSSKIPVIWDKPTNHENYGNVLFLDGHVKGFAGKDWMEQAGIKKTANKGSK